VTTRKRAEREREELLAKERAARAEAEAATRAKDEFLATVTHELRSPLNSILGWNAMLKKQPSPEMVGRVTEIIERQGKQQLQLIEDLLDTARIVAGKMKIEQQPVDLAIVISAALDVVRPAANSRKIALSMMINTTDAIVTGDAERLQQVVWNLLSNAVKFTSDGGRVEIELQREDPFAAIIVRDTGKGIEPEFLPYIFERFSQAESSESRRFGGLGLGLALVKQLTELHGGSVEVYSEGENKGAVFTVKFPIRAVSAAENELEKNLAGWESDKNFSASEKPAGILSGARILVADDIADARELVALTLERHGAAVETYESGAAALAALEDKAVDARFDLFICDIGMPGADGYAIIKKLREAEAKRGENLPAVALTAFTSPQDKRRALEAGFQMHIGKPVEPEELVAVVSSLLAAKKLA
jgi:CheY-like chemotaxis protein